MLTKNAQNLLRALYEDYSTRINSGKSIDDAKQFGACDEIQKKHAQSLSASDTNTVLHELKDNGYLNLRDYDATVIHAILTDPAIAFMESKT